MFCSNRLKTKEKFASRSMKCIFLGYPFGQKRWKIYDLETHEIFVNRDVIFYEEIFPFPYKSKTPDTLAKPPAHPTKWGASNFGQHNILTTPAHIWPIGRGRAPRRARGSKPSLADRGPTSRSKYYGLWIADRGPISSPDQTRSSTGPRCAIRRPAKKAAGISRWFCFLRWPRWRPHLTWYTFSHRVLRYALSCH